MTTNNAENSSPESKQQIGIRLANQRMPKVKKALELIGNLGSYGLSPKHVSLIDKALANWVEDARDRLKNKKRNDDNYFQLD